MGLIGTVAGVVGAALAWPLAAALRVDFDVGQAWWTIPVAVALTMLAGAVATRRAGSTRPIDALRPLVRQGKRAGGNVGSAAALGFRMILRRPNRIALGAAAVALATAAVGLLSSILVSFQGAVVGTLLGDAVAVQVRQPDLIAAAVLVVLGTVSVAVILFLGLVEDARSFAALQAVGWSDKALGTVVVAQAAIIGLIGGIVGALAGVGLIAGIVGALDPGSVAVCFAVGAGVALLAVAAAFIPAALLRRLPTARLLAEE